MKPLIQLENLNFSYGHGREKQRVLQDINLELMPGSITKITGRNGSGKTTLLKLISGDLTPESGFRNIGSHTRIAYLDQNAFNCTAAGLTIREHLAACIGPTQAVDSAMGDPEDLLQAYDLGLEKRMDDFVGHLSGGQRQIIALLTATLSGANLFCLDEFTSAMDSVSTEVAQAFLVGNVESRSIAAVYVDHKTWLENGETVELI